MKKDISDILCVIGIIAICFGIAMINIAAAIILAGLFCIAVSYFIYRSRNKGGNK